MYNLFILISNTKANQYLKLLLEKGMFQMECVGVNQYCNTKVFNKKSQFEQGCLLKTKFYKKHSYYPLISRQAFGPRGPQRKDVGVWADEQPVGGGLKTG